MNTLIPVLLVTVALTIVASLVWRKQQRGQRIRFIQHVTFPDNARRKLREMYPSLTLAQEGLVTAALRDYFRIAFMAQPRVVAMPSKAVDVLWHEFILATHDYHRFCQKAFGHYLHHVPNEAMGDAERVRNSLKRCWRIACKLEDIDPLKPSRLPRLFRVDAELNIPGGYHYALDCRQSGRETPYCGSHVGCSSCGGGAGGGGGAADGGSSCGSSGCGGGD